MMRIQRVTRVGGVREECVLEAGATPVLRTSRVGSATLVAPAPQHHSFQEIASTDTERICVEFKPDRLSIDR